MDGFCQSSLQKIYCTNQELVCENISVVDRKCKDVSNNWCYSILESDSICVDISNNNCLDISLESTPDT